MTFSPWEHYLNIIFRQKQDKLFWMWVRRKNPTCLIEEILIKRTYFILDNNLKIAAAFQLWNWGFVSVSEYWSWDILKNNFSSCFETEDIKMIAVFHSAENSRFVQISVCLQNMLHKNVNKIIIIQKPTTHSLIHAHMHITGTSGDKMRRSNCLKQFCPLCHMPTRDYFKRQISCPYLE